MMKLVHIKADFPDALVDILEAPDGVVMVVPFRDGAEVVRFGDALNATAHALDVAKRALATLVQVGEGRTVDPAMIQKTAVMLAEPMARAAEFLDEIRQIIGRAAFAPRTPERKGPIQ